LLSRMRCKALLLLLPLLTSCVRYNFASYYAEFEPPARYDHPYDGPVVEQVLSLAQVREICGYENWGCAWITAGTCYRVLLSDGPVSVSFLRRHETAHCNGWPGDHPRD